MARGRVDHTHTCGCGCGCVVSSVRSGVRWRVVFDRSGSLRAGRVACAWFVCQPRGWLVWALGGVGWSSRALARSRVGAYVIGASCPPRRRAYAGLLLLPPRETRGKEQARFALRTSYDGRGRLGVCGDEVSLCMVRTCSMVETALYVIFFHLI
uniref:Uncharacterized protein n=1 Tax=Leersia perrieri TaxID=77586 RepID=A0A0D9X0L7_9ORYZ